MAGLQRTGSHQGSIALSGVMLLVLLLGMALLPAGQTQAFAAGGFVVQEDAPTTMTVQFRRGIGVTGSLPQASGDLMVYEAFAETGAAAPASDDPACEFKGWALAADAASALPNSTKLSDAYAQAGSDGILRFFAVFGPVAKPHLTFMAPDGATVLAEADVQTWQSLRSAGVAPDPEAADELTGQPLFRKLGSCFAGWAAADGAAFMSDEPIVADIVLMPRYRSLSARLGNLKGASADLSSAYLLCSGAERAIDAGFRLEKANAADAKLTKAAKADGYKSINTYQILFGFTDEEETTLVKQGFGTVSAVLPADLANNTTARVYWLRSDNTVGKSSAVKVKKGGVAFSFSDLTISSKGNALVAYKAPSKSAADASKQDSSKTSSAHPSDDSWSSAAAAPPRQSVPATRPSTMRPPATPSTTPTTPTTRPTPSVPTVSVPTAGAEQDSTASQSSASSAAAAPASPESGASSPASSVPPGAVQADDASGDGADSEQVDELDLDLQDAAEEGEPPAKASAAQKMGSRDGGLVYGVLMLVIAGLAVGAWALVSRYDARQRAAAPEVLADSASNPVAS